MLSGLYLSFSRSAVAAFASTRGSTIAFSSTSTAGTQARLRLRSFSSSSTTALSAALQGILVSVDDCLASYGESDVKFVDGSWHLAADRDGRSDYEAGPRIAGASYFDIDDISSKGDLNPKGLPHMMPPARLFAAAMDALGISNDDHLVVYGTDGCIHGCRESLAGGIM